MIMCPAAVFAVGWVLLFAATWQSVDASCLGPSWPRSNVSGGLAPVSIDFQNWESHILVSAVASILMQEGLGQQVVLDMRGVQAHSAGLLQAADVQWMSGWFERLAHGSLSTNLEVWTTGVQKQARLAGYRCAPDYVHGSSPPAQCVHEVFHRYGGASAQFYAAQPPGGSVNDFDYWRR
eukprot:COSAG01_NODE_19467_length_1008_cov_0.870187_1_plen_178_part_10